MEPVSLLQASSEAVRLPQSATWSSSLDSFASKSTNGSSSRSSGDIRFFWRRGGKLPVSKEGLLAKRTSAMTAGVTAKPSGKMARAVEESFALTALILLLLVIVVWTYGAVVYGRRAAVPDPRLPPPRREVREDKPEDVDVEWAQGSGAALSAHAVYPPLAVPLARTRLAIPAQPLFEPEFDIDVLGAGASGLPLFNATLTAAPFGEQSIRIVSHSGGTRLIVITPALELIAGESTLFGTLRRGCWKRYELHDAGGIRLLTIVRVGRAGEFNMFAHVAGRTLECASVSRQPAGQLPKEHYEVVVSPNIDTLLALACFLALVVFGRQPGEESP